MLQNLKKYFKKSSIKISHSQCLSNGHEASTCSNCEEVCPQPALTIVHRKPHLNLTNCNDCRLCVHACPTEAIQLDGECFTDYENRITSKNTVTFACKEHGSRDSDVVLPCISTLTPELAMVASANDKKMYVLWDEKICRSCHSHWTHKRSFEWIDEWNRINLSNNKIEIISYKGTKFNLKKRLVEKKDVFKKQERQEKELRIEDLNIPVINDKLSITTKRLYVLAFIKKLQPKGLVPKELAKKLGLIKIKVKNNCILCKKCSDACPTGALQLKVIEKRRTLVFLPQYCINCDICVHSCLEIKKCAVAFEEVNNEIILKEY